MLTKADFYMIDTVHRAMDGENMNQLAYRYNLNEGDFPILTLEPVEWRSAIGEILKFYRGLLCPIADLRHTHSDWVANDEQPGGQFMTMMTADDTFLDMTLVQRGGDLFTMTGPGLKYEVQYATLLIAIARHNGLIPRNFVHFVQEMEFSAKALDYADLLIKKYDHVRYHRSVDIAKGLKTWSKGPEMILSPAIDDFYRMTEWDFEIKSYNPLKKDIKI